MRARAVLATAVMFALAMAALEHGGWWWAWLGTGMVLFTARRLPLIGRAGLSPVNRYIIHHNRKTRKANRKMARQRAKANRQKSRNNKRIPRFPL